MRTTTIKSNYAFSEFGPLFMLVVRQARKIEGETIVVDEVVEFDKFQKLVDELKRMSGYINLTMEFNPVCHLTEVEPYNLPVFSSKIRGKAEIRQAIYTTIAKEWEQVHSLGMKMPSNLKDINKYLKYLGITLTDEETLKFREVLKQGGYVNFIR